MSLFIVKKNEIKNNKLENIVSQTDKKIITDVVPSLPYTTRIISLPVIRTSFPDDTDRNIYSRHAC